MSESNIIFYTTPNGQVQSQKRMGELFGVDVRTINEHLKNIYQSSE
ncbi:MAG: hypothetical protein LBL13_13100 [Bacteroidales bacterium]|jgi:DNA-binding CsgD family transcriptional regulator|nr:hypothetical protein [Bacteroidales bacterium]